MALTILPVTGIGSTGTGSPPPPPSPGGSGSTGSPGTVGASGGASAPLVTPPAANPQTDPTSIVDLGLYSGSNELYAEVFDVRTHEVIRLIPPEQVLQFFAGIYQEVGKQVDVKS